MLRSVTTQNLPNKLYKGIQNYMTNFESPCTGNEDLKIFIANRNQRALWNYMNLMFPVAPSLFVDNESPMMFLLEILHFFVMKKMDKLSGHSGRVLVVRYKSNWSFIGYFVIVVQRIPRQKNVVMRDKSNRRLLSF